MNIKKFYKDVSGAALVYVVLASSIIVLLGAATTVTAYANLKAGVTEEAVRAAYDKYYKEEKFVRVLDKDVCPQTKWVEGSNYVDVNFKIDPRTNRIIMMGAIDNLVKGAAGQAVQNMNLMFGFKETEGLELIPMFPQERINDQNYDNGRL